MFSVLVRQTKSDNFIHISELILSFTIGLTTNFLTKRIVVSCSLPSFGTNKLFGAVYPALKWINCSALWNVLNRRGYALCLLTIQQKTAKKCRRKNSYNWIGIEWAILQVNTIVMNLKKTITWVNKKAGKEWHSP